MGRQWLHAKREVANLKKGQVVGKLVKEMMVAAKLGGPDIESNARLFAVVEKARKASVTRDAIERAIKKGAGIGGEKLVLDHLVFEGYAPHKVPVIVEVLTDNNNRTAPEIRVLFKRGQLGTPGTIRMRRQTSRRRRSKPERTMWHRSRMRRTTTSRKARRGRGS